MKEQLFSVGIQHIKTGEKINLEVWAKGVREATHGFLQTEYLTENGPWSMEGEVYRRLRQKEQTMLEAIGRRTLEVLPTSEEDLEMIFKPLLQ